MGVGSPNSLSSDEANEQIAGMLRRWGPDPVHPTEEAYAQLAEMLLAKMASASLPDADKWTQTEPGSNRNRKRKRSPSRDRRPSWVSESITEVGRGQAGSSGRYGQHGKGPDARGPGSKSTNFSNKDAHGGSFRGRGGYAGRRGGHRGPRGNQGHRGGHSGNAAPWTGPR